MIKNDVFAIAIPFIKQFEKCSLTEYLDSAGYPTIGWGQRITHGQYPHGITQVQADALLLAALSWRYDRMIPFIHTKLNANQLAAVLSFIYNVGFGSITPFTDGFITSHLLTLINCNCLQAAVAEFPRWDKAKGVELGGLKRRRLCEGLLFGGKTIADLVRLNWLE